MTLCLPFPPSISLASATRYDDNFFSQKSLVHTKARRASTAQTHCNYFRNHMEIYISVCCILAYNWNQKCGRLFKIHVYQYMFSRLPVSPYLCWLRGAGPFSWALQVTCTALGWSTGAGLHHQGQAQSRDGFRNRIIHKAWKEMGQEEMWILPTFFLFYQSLWIQFRQHSILAMKMKWVKLGKRIKHTQ